MEITAKSQLNKIIKAEVKHNLDPNLKFSFGKSKTLNFDEASRAIRKAPLAIAPLAIAPLAIAPLAIAPLAIAPLATAPLAIAPSAIAPLAIAPSTIAPLAIASTVIALGAIVSGAIVSGATASSISTITAQIKQLSTNENSVDGALSGQVLLMIYSYRTRRADLEYIYSSRSKRSSQGHVKVKV